MHVWLDRVNGCPHVLSELHWPARTDEHAPKPFACFRAHVKYALLRAADEVAQPCRDAGMAREEREPGRKFIRAACARWEGRASMEHNNLERESSRLRLREERCEDGEHRGQAVCNT